MNADREATSSLWEAAEASDAAGLEGMQRCDTVIVGAGIAGLSVAYELVAAGCDAIAELPPGAL
jgi:ribulose 1,5-bisphosphate synthetase/thiazole synthase